MLRLNLAPDLTSDRVGLSPERPDLRRHLLAETQLLYRAPSGDDPRLHSSDRRAIDSLLNGANSGESTPGSPRSTPGSTPGSTTGSTPGYNPGYSLDHALGNETDSEDAYLVALSDSDTLAAPRRHRLQLQETFDDNFTGYLPFVLRRRRARHQEPELPISDDETISAQVPTILGQPTNVFNMKRSLVVAREFIKLTSYVFPDEALFTKFKQLRKKRDQKGAIVYDQEGNILKVGSPSEVPVGSTLDTRLHIIPVDLKLRGEGLPLFKVIIPYMLQIRKKVPFMIIRRYREVPLPPKACDKEDEDKNYELYVFCTVHVKNFTGFKRFIFHFTPLSHPHFKLLVFQLNFSPFADFCYKSTRFRVSGTSLTNPYLMTYNPELKLYVLDPQQPHLCDDIVDKLGGLGEGHGDAGVADPTDLPNPVPAPTSPTLKYLHCVYTGFDSSPCMPTNLPPFGRFLDSCAYNDDGPLFPKKYNNIGTVELYQDCVGVDVAAPTSTTGSVDFDTHVICAVLLALQETRVRNTTRYPLTRIGGRIGALPARPGMAPPSVSFFNVM